MNISTTPTHTHKKKKKKKKKGNTKKYVLQFFPTNKETKERNVLIRNKVGIENVEIRVIK